MNKCDRAAALPSGFCSTHVCFRKNEEHPHHPLSQVSSTLACVANVRLLPAASKKKIKDCLSYQLT